MSRILDQLTDPKDLKDFSEPIVPNEVILNSFELTKNPSDLNLRDAVLFDPIKVGCYKVLDRLHQYDDNLEDVYYKFDLTQFLQRKPVNVAVRTDLELFDSRHDKELRLNTFLDYLYNNRKDFQIVKTIRIKKNTNKISSSDADDTSSFKYLKLKEPSHLRGRLIDVDFITVRGTLHSLIKTVYQYDSDYCIYAERLGKTIYLYAEKVIKTNMNSRYSRYS